MASFCVVAHHLICEVLDEGVVDLTLGGRLACLEQPHGEAHDAQNTDNKLAKGTRDEQRVRPFDADCSGNSFGPRRTGTRITLQ